MNAMSQRRAPFWRRRAAWIGPVLGTLGLLARGSEPVSDHITLRPLSAAEQLAEQSDGRRGEPLRVGHPIAVQLTPARHGRWEQQADGSSRWTLSLTSPGARWLVLGFGVFRPVPGAVLTVFDVEGRVTGRWDQAAERPHGQLWVGPLAGAVASLQLDWPAEAVNVEPRIELNVVSHGFRGLEALIEKGLGASGSCNIDVRCPLGDDWQDEKRGVLLILNGGSDHCSGSLINNTARDCKGLILTAAHCVSSQGGVNQLSWVFNFERSSCGSGDASRAQQLAAGTLRATSSTTDVTLIELSDPIPSEWNPYFNGWSRSSTPATQATGIHHPSGDAKKISRDDNGTILGSSWGPDHWRVPSWDQGVTEGGSSGSPLFDQNSRIIGQLHGGESSCATRTWDEYGRFDLSWDGGGAPSSRLRDWLDPLGSSPPALDGLDATFCSAPNAELRYVAQTLDDSGGNGSGGADPGETVRLALTIQNDGNQTASGVDGQLGSSAPGLSISDDTAAWSDLAPAAQGQSLAPHFTLQLPADAVCGSALPLSLLNRATDPAGSWSSALELRVGHGVNVVRFSDAAEAGIGNWVSTSLQGNAAWTQVTQDSHSPTHSWFVPDLNRRTDTVLVMEPLAALEPGAELRFFHKYRTENFRDGGVLEYSLDEGPWTDAGSLIRSGGYVALINAAASSNLAGRNAWAGDSAGWQEVVVDLSSFAGRTVRCRWRFATDLQNSSSGWAIDDITVRSLTFECQPVAVRPGEASGPGGAQFSITAVSDQTYQLQWSTPITGGAANRYLLYRYALPLGGSTLPSCEADLGSGTNATLTSLSANHGFVVVARNAAGEGSFGTTSTGAERPAATAPCP